MSVTAATVEQSNPREVNVAHAQGASHHGCLFEGLQGLTLRPYILIFNDEGILLGAFKQRD